MILNNIGTNGSSIIEMTATIEIEPISEIEMTTPFLLEEYKIGWIVTFNIAKKIYFVKSA